MSNLFNYTIFGLSFESQLVIPGLERYDSESVDVRIGYGTVPEHLEHVIASGVLFESGSRDFLLKLPDICDYYARDGEQITIDPKPGATEQEIRLFLFGSVLGAILFQRGYLPLHGSAVEVNGKALLIIGNSSVGKSTLAASLWKSGYPLLSDDLSSISLKKSGKCIVHMGLPFVKLWQDTLDIISPMTELERVRPQINKYLVPVYNKHKIPCELEPYKVINLTTHNEKQLEITPISGANKFASLRDHVYRDRLIMGMGIVEDQFKIISQLSNQVELFRIARPSRPMKVDYLSELVIKEIIQK